MDATYKRHSRRSHPNLQHLSLAPLTPQFPLPSTEDLDALNETTSASTSYIAPRSQPQSPSILSFSRSSSRSRTRGTHRASKSSQTLADLASPNPKLTPLPTSKSSSNLTFRVTRSSPGGLKTVKSTEHTDWLLQTASTLTTTTAESKGQAWLAIRQSSTSLAVDNSPSPNDQTLNGGERSSRRASGAEADDELSPVSFRNYGNQWSSRDQSRVGSARSSRRSSKVALMTPYGLKTPGEQDGGAEDYFRDQGPIFVDVNEEEDEEDVADEGEMKRLVRSRLGGWMDWAVGWMDFGVDEQLGDDDEEEAGSGSAEKEVEQSSKGRWITTKRERERERERAAREPNTSEKANVPPPKGDSALGDAAWLLNVAAKSLV
ncbi:MAG: hypothetical protein MMC33_002061 [Icmadophila ericetorum]|nr:hypothetical protein [Icmadophila ericetorum]